MPDAQIIINGGIVTEPRWNETQNGRVGNLNVRAGRSQKEQDGSWTTLSSTAYDCAAWNEVHDALATQNPVMGSQVQIVGRITGVHTYQAKDGSQGESIKVSVDSIRVYPPRQQGGYGQQGQGAAGGQSGYGGGFAGPQGGQGHDGNGGGAPWDEAPF